MNARLIVICGWALSGKSTIAAGIKGNLDFDTHWIDIDEIRFLNFGPPNPRPDTSEELMQRDRMEMKGSYELLYATIEKNLVMGKSVLVTATFSRARYWNEILEILKRCPEVNVKVVSCEPQNDSKKETRNRINGRVFGKNTWSAVNSIKRYNEVKDRYESPPLPHLKLDSSPPNTIGKCVQEVIAYIQS